MVGGGEAFGLGLLSKFVDRPRQALDSAIEAGIAPNELGLICAEFTANRALFRSGGAIVDRIRNGSWPVAGVKSIEEIAKASEMANNEKPTWIAREDPIRRGGRAPPQRSLGVGDGCRNRARSRSEDTKETIGLVG